MSGSAYMMWLCFITQNIRISLSDNNHRWFPVCWDLCEASFKTITAKKQKTPLGVPFVFLSHQRIDRVPPQFRKHGAPAFRRNPVRCPRITGGAPRFRVAPPKRKVAQAAFSFWYSSLFSLHSSLFSNLSPRDFSREEIIEKREKKR